MNTKSAIQLFLESMQLKERFKNELARLLDQYVVEGNVFAMNPNGSLREVTNGYFVEKNTYDTIAECVRNMTSPSHAVQIKENKFILGQVESQLSNCQEAQKVLDLEFLQYVRE